MRVVKAKNQLWVIALPVLLVVTSLGCSLSDRLTGSNNAADSSRPTRTPMPTFTPTPQGAAFVEIPSATPTNTPEPIPTATPAPPTPIPEPTQPPAPEAVTVTLLQNMNVRSGPGTNYPIAGPGPAGETAKVLGRNAGANWLQVEYPLTDDRTGWVFAELVQINGDPQTAAVVNAPPPPVAAAPPAQPQPEVQPEQPAAPPAPSYQFVPGAWAASENAGICHFKGRIRDEGGNLVNGYSVYVSNGSWGTVSHPTGASVWYPDKGDGEWDVAGIGLNQCPGWWTLTVVKYECNFAGGFDAQCKNYSKLSEEIPVELVYPKEMVINADWVCRHDCDKGVYSQAFRRN